jgi:hypothetical protein
MPTAHLCATQREQACSLPFVNNRDVVAGAGHFQLGLGHFHLAFRGLTVERPFQLVALELIRTRERLPEHGKLRRAVLEELCRDLDAPLPGFPLTDDQVLRAGTAAGRQSQSHASQHANREIRFHVDSVWPKNTAIVQILIPSTRPRPIGRTLYRPLLNRIAMHVVQFLQAFPFTPNVEVIETSLPNTAGRLIVNRFGQGHPRQHAARPTLFMLRTSHIRGFEISSQSPTPKEPGQRIPSLVRFVAYVTRTVGIRKPIFRWRLRWLKTLTPTLINSLVRRPLFFCTLSADIPCSE